MARSAVPPAPQALLLAAAGHTCAAWWHAPAAAPDARGLPAGPRGWIAGSPPTLAVVLASSWGDEDIAGYDDLRALACALAAGGVGALRFEWPDTGDSSAASGATTIADARAAFDAAATLALALSGCERLAFVGLRLGALLAAHAAAARRDVDALVAWRPVASGRAFVREQRGLGVVAVPQPLAAGAAFDPALLPMRLGGFVQTVRQVEALSWLRWPPAATTAVLEALLLTPAQARGRAAADALARMGTRVHEWVHRDAAGTPAIAEIVRWLHERAADATVTHGVARIADFGVADAGNAQAHAAAAAARLSAATAAVLALAAADPPTWMRIGVAGVAVRERFVRIEAAHAPALVGVLCESDPPVGVGPGGRRAIVLLSSGPGRRIGPHRLWVPFARQRAACGDLVLRLDGADSGDSEGRARLDPHAAPDPDDPRCVDDVARAVAWLRRECGVGPCTVIGVGAGALPAWRAALQGVDVQQVVAINPPGFHRSPGPVLAPAGIAPGARRRRAPSPGGSPRLFARAIARLLRRPLPDDLVAQLQRATGRGVALDFVFSPDAPGLGLLRQACARCASTGVGGGRIQACEVAHADRSFAGTAGRLALYARLDALLAPVGATTPCAVAWLNA